MKVTFTVTGAAEMFARLQKIETEVRPAVERALFEEARALFEASQALVPVDQGPLKASGAIQPPVWAGDLCSAGVTYGSAAVKYAWSVHENPRSGRTGGVSPSGRRYKTWAATGSWKYLEYPAAERAKGFEARVTAAVRDALVG